MSKIIRGSWPGCFAALRSRDGCTELIQARAVGGGRWDWWHGIRSRRGVPYLDDCTERRGCGCDVALPAQPECNGTARKNPAAQNERRSARKIAPR
jgi:hypothetical protein